MAHISLQISIADGKVWDESIENWVALPDDYGIAIMEPSATLSFDIEYPLHNPKSIVLTHEDNTGWTERQFVEAVCKEYADVYKEEGEDPGHVLGLQNRATSNGPHGIWGHDIGDLVLEGAEKRPDGRWEIDVGS